MNANRLSVAAACLCLAACSPADQASPPPPAASSAASLAAGQSPLATPQPTLTDVASGTQAPEGMYDVGGFSLRLQCSGTGSPTVVFEAGLGSGHEAWSAVAPRVAASSRACTYDRAGIGRSEPRPAGTTSAGAMADELARLLVAADIAGPIVLVGHSYGGMVVQLAADRLPDDVVGVVLVDSSSGPQFEEGFPVTNFEWTDGATVVDKVATATELAAVDLGAIPLIVLTQDGLDGDIGADWARYQGELAALSSTSVHLTARGAGHGIQDEASELVVAAVTAVVEAVEGAALPPCSEFAAVGGACFER